jgi:hypothetical protein
MTAKARSTPFLRALRAARRRAGEFLEAEVGLSIELRWLRDIGSALLLTFEVREPYGLGLGGRVPITLRHAIATQLEPRLARYQPLIRLSDTPRSRAVRLRRTVSFAS